MERVYLTADDRLDLARRGNCLGRNDGALPASGEQVCYGYVQSVGDLDDDVQGRVAAAGLDGSYVGAVQPGSFGHVFLGPVALRAEAPHVLAEGAAMRSLLIRPPVRHATTIVPIPPKVRTR